MTDPVVDDRHVIPGWEIWFLVAVLVVGGLFFVNTFVNVVVGIDEAASAEVDLGQVTAPTFSLDGTRVLVGASLAAVFTAIAAVTVRRTDWSATQGYATWRAPTGRRVR